MNPSTASVLALALLSAVPLVHADEVHLRDGRIIEGEVLSQPGDGDVTITTRAGGMSATLHLRASEVLSISYGVSAQQRKLADFTARKKALSEREAQVPQPASEWWRMAEEAKALGENVAFRELAQATVDHDRDFAPARLALGFVQQDGVWMKPAEAAVARGEVWFRGRWTPAAQRDAILAEEARAAQELATRQAADQQRRQAELDLAKQAADLRAAQRAAEPAPAPQIIFGTYSTVPTVLTGSWNCGPWNNSVVTGGQWTGCGPGGWHHEQQPRREYGGLDLSASGQGNGFNWGLTLH